MANFGSLKLKAIKKLREASVDIGANSNAQLNIELPISFEVLLGAIRRCIPVTEELVDLTGEIIDAATHTYRLSSLQLGHLDHIEVRKIHPLFTQILTRKLPDDLDEHRLYKRQRVLKHFLESLQQDRSLQILDWESDSTSESPEVQKTKLYDLLESAFSLDELKELFWRVDSNEDWDNLPGLTTRSKIREVIEYCSRRGKTASLLEWIFVVRPELKSGGTYISDKE